MTPLSTNTKITLGFLVALALLLGISIVASRETRALIGINRRVAHTHEVIATLEHVLADLNDTETGQRGYLITGEAPYLEPYRAALGAVGETMQHLRRVTADDPDQQQRLATLEPLVTQKLAELQETIDVRAHAGFEAAAQVVRTDRGKQLMDHVRVVVQDMSTAEQALLRQRQQTAAVDARATLATIVYGDVLALVVVALAGYTVTRDLTKRQQAERALAALNADLEQRVADRTRALQRTEEAEREQREFLQVTLASIGDAVIVTTAQGVVTFLSRVAAEVTGWTTADALGKSLPDVFHIINEETRQPVENPVAKVLRTGRIAGLANHTVLIRKDGSVCPIDDSAAPIRDEQGRLLGIILVFRDIRERRQAEEVLRQSEARYRTLSELVSDYAYAVRIEPDGRGVVEWVTEAFRRITGFTVRELETAGGLERLLHPEDRPSVRHRLQALLAGQPGTSEHRIITKSGEVRWLRDHSRPEWDAAHERIVRIIGAGQDITADKQAEEVRLRLAAIVESSDEAIISKSLDGVVTTWNSGAERIFGYRAEEMLGQPILRLLPDERHAEEQGILERLRRGDVTRFETVRRTKDGRSLYMSVTISPLRDARGTIIGASKIARDITARKQAESALRESEARVRAVLTTTVDGIITIDERGAIELLNPAAERLFGYGAQEILGQNVKRLMPAPYQDEHDGYLANYRRTGEAKVIGIGREVVGQRRDGTTFPLELAVSEVRLPDRRLFTGIVRDITARKQAAEAQVRLLAELQRANEELRQFAYIVSHDLSEPLRTIASYIELLVRRHQGQLDTEADEYLAFAVDGAQRMQQMITALLAYTRVGGQLPEFTAVDCEALLAQVMSDLQVALTEQQATLTHDPLPTVGGDATRLKQVFQNLIGNALKFHGVAPPRIHVAVQREDHQWRFSVHDNGIGIDPRHAERIFQVFQRLHTRREYPGTGIGLAICKKIVEQHGGRIWVESQPEAGSIFYFTLQERRQDKTI